VSIFEHEKITHRSRPAIDHRVSAVSSIMRHFRTSCISFAGSSVVPDLLAPHKLRRRMTAEANAGICVNKVNKCVPSLTNEKCTHDSIWRSTQRVLLPHCIGNVAICTCGARAYRECSERQRTPFARRRDERTVDGDLYEIVRRAQIRRLDKEGLVLAVGIPAHYRVRDKRCGCIQRRNLQ
jgi:hypothetical protein